jgi:hypothetical protein
MRSDAWPGVAQIIGGPGNTIIAATSDASMKNGGPMITLFDANGNAIGAHDGTGVNRGSKLEALQHARNVCLQRISENRFAMYEPASSMILIQDVEAEAKGNHWTGISGIFTGDDPHTAHLPVIGFEVSADGNEVLVARTGQIHGRYATQLRLYVTRSHDVKQTSVTEVPWNFMLRDNDRVHGVVRHKDVVLDTVRFVAD